MEKQNVLGHLPWLSNGAIAKLKLFKSLGNTKKKLTMEVEY
jgi:hypothetical protein